MGRLIRFLASVKVAIVLISLLALLCALATLIPQGLEESWYLSSYPPGIARVILTTGYDGFFSSLPFMVLAGLFFINLFACTLRRLLSQLTRGLKGRYGPDVLHAGILILVSAAALSGIFRVSVPVELAAGDGISLSEGITVQVKSLEATVHPDGRPKDWRTEVRVVTPQRPDGYDRVIRVNKPLSVGGASLYQYSWKQGDVARIWAGGRPMNLEYGESVTLDDGRTVGWEADLVGKGTETRAAGLLIDHEAVGLVPGQEHKGVRLESITYMERTVLLAGRDRAYPFVVFSFLLICLGLVLIAVDRFLIVYKENSE